jgi:hypothetical protein
MMSTSLAMPEQLPEQGDPTAQRMAAFIVERLEKNGSCSIHDIKTHGFSLNDIDRYWPEACRIAESSRPAPDWFCASER